MNQKTENSRKCDNMLCCGFPTLSTRRLQSNFHHSCVFAQVVQQAVSTSQAETWAADDETASVAKSNANSRANNCELGILANVKLPATSEYPTLSTKYYIYELLWNSRFELNDEWPFVRW